MAKLSQYVDKEHAVGHIECLERHFKKISDRLDRADVPQTDKEGNVYTILQRVGIACTALHNTRGRVSAIANMEVLRFRAFEDEDDAEEIMESIYG